MNVYTFPENTYNNIISPNKKKIENKFITIHPQKIVNTYVALRLNYARVHCTWYNSVYLFCFFDCLCVVWCTYFSERCIRVLQAYITYAIRIVHVRNTLRGKICMQCWYNFPDSYFTNLDCFRCCYTCTCLYNNGKVFAIT